MPEQKIETKDIVNYLDQYLRIREISDTSLNGLQVQGKPEIEKIGFAVDACVETFEAANQAAVDLLVVHHGLFWGKEQPVTGSHYARFKALIESGMNLYCAHLPLDAHPEVGNNAQIANALDLEIEYYFGDYQGTPIAVYGRTKTKITAKDFLNDVKKLLGNHVRLDAFGPEMFRNVGICTGAGAMLLPEAKSIGIEAFI
ncbi:MAG: Nif3-like dinuclear metal center hexameric protein, partial [bacterium]